VPNLSVTPIIDGLAVTDTVSTVTLSRTVGSVIIENQSATVNLYVTIDGTTPVAVFGTDQVYRIKPGKALCLERQQISFIKGICEAGLSADMQYAAWSDIGSGGGAF